jgi:hypothetical protein
MGKRVVFCTSLSSASSLIDRYKKKTKLPISFLPRQDDHFVRVVDRVQIGSHEWMFIEMFPNQTDHIVRMIREFVGDSDYHCLHLDDIDKESAGEILNVCRKLNKSSQELIDL